LGHDACVAEVSAIRQLHVHRIDRFGLARASDDAVAVEAPLEFRLDGAPGAVTMRTPGDDHELLRGFLFGEGLIADADEIREIRAPEDLAPEDRGHVLDVRLRNPLARKRLPERSSFASSSCGVCGKVSLASLRVRAPRVQAPLRVEPAVLAGLPDRLRAAQAVFETTGGLHAAAAFDARGELLAVREDVGRHNAVDKLIGWALGERRVPLHDAIVQVSGRLSFEILQKAIVAGVPVVCAVSAPSSLAVELAEEFGVTVCGFVRGGRLNVYSAPERVIGLPGGAARAGADAAHPAGEQ
jgi:FdhD protein